MLKTIFSNSISAYHHHKNYFFTFLLAGAGTAIIYFSLFTLFWYALHINHIIAVTLSYVAAGTFHFFTNRIITFKAKDGILLQHVFKYISLIFINYLINVIIVQITIWLMISPYIGLIIATGITAITGYFLSKYWIFKSTTSILLEENQ